MNSYRKFEVGERVEFNFDSILQYESRGHYGTIIQFEHAWISKYWDEGLWYNDSYIEFNCALYLCRIGVKVDKQLPMITKKGEEPREMFINNIIWLDRKELV